jgi:hypothetical protein
MRFSSLRTCGWIVAKGLGLSFSYFGCMSNVKKKRDRGISKAECPWKSAENTDHTTVGVAEQPDGRFVLDAVLRRSETGP